MNYLIVGLGESGKGAVKFLEDKNEKIFVFDENRKLCKKIKNAKIFSEKVEFLLKINKKTLKLIDYLILSPGIEPKKYEKIAKKFNIKIMGELELGYLNYSGELVCITGTNGKTTTVHLLFEMLKIIYPNTALVGNVGNSFCCELSKNKFIDFAICEASSFQLETIDKFKPNVVGFLNICDDHLDRYKNFENYFNAKKNIFKNFSPLNVAVLNFDDEKLYDFSKTLNCKKYYFSLNTLPENFFGAYLKDDKIVFRLENQNYILDRKNIKLLGRHNLYNIMCSSIISLLYGLNFDCLKNCLNKFYGLEHRIEFVKEINGIKFYNDSKGTNIHSTQNAISCFEDDVLLLLGGKDKKENFNNLFKTLPKNVTKIIAFGETKNKILKSAKKFGFKNIETVKNLKSAVEKINTKLIHEKVVLLSPACSSFDEFSCFEERGNCFKSLVKGRIDA